MHRHGVDILMAGMQTAAEEEQFCLPSRWQKRKGIPYKWEISGERRQK